MTVLGIAGPGDPLANPERTFETFRMLSEQAPTSMLSFDPTVCRCPTMSRNWKYNIDHSDHHINCVDPDWAPQIYPWIFGKQTHQGREAARHPDRAANRRGWRCCRQRHSGKSEFGADPGVNDKHLEEVSKVVKA